MKREFGKKLIEEFFPRVQLTHVIDTSGAYIPGHGTPTVILAGRNQVARQEEDVRAVLGVRGEPSQPDNPEEGLVWRAIVAQVATPGSESEWASVTDAARGRFSTFPWSLQGGNAHDLMTKLSFGGGNTVSDRVKLIGRTTHTGSDSAYFAPPGSWTRRGVPEKNTVQLVEGTAVRDYQLLPETQALFPYSMDLKADLRDEYVERILWPLRADLRQRREPNGNHEEIGLTWYEWSRWHPERYTVPLGIAMAFIATHNHFVLDRGGKVFNRSAPVIKLPEGASEEHHLELLGVLNSSAACFWLKQVSQAKGPKEGPTTPAAEEIAGRLKHGLTVTSSLAPNSRNSPSLNSPRSLSVANLTPWPSNRQIMSHLLSPVPWSPHAKLSTRRVGRRSGSAPA
ncbi:BREX-2 system adenine-specific DNA-methyltransferase PglX [Streptomyces sp. 067-1]|uniref:BREX-2 system adenine-specific DNA-methyltransferase PglX n=1 Tax=Streptomyces sp. 067-1 TaxID=2789269 RepID=UPI0039F4D419